MQLSLNEFDKKFFDIIYTLAGHAEMHGDVLDFHEGKRCIRALRQVGGEDPFFHGTLLKYTEVSSSSRSGISRIR